MELIKAILKAHDGVQFKPDDSGIDNVRFVLECLSDLDMGKLVGELRKACEGNTDNLKKANCAIFDVVQRSGLLSLDEFRVGFEYEEHIPDTERYLNKGMIWKKKTYGLNSPRLHKIQQQLEQGKLRRLNCI